MMQHKVWKPNSKQRPAVEAICGLVVDFDKRVKFGDAFIESYGSRVPCPGCYGPTPELHHEGKS